MEIEEVKYKIGYLVRMDIELEKPYPMNFSGVEMRKLTMMTGMNGTGKSLIMKISWIMNTIANYCAYSQEFPERVDFEKEINFLFDNTFSDNNFTGVIGGHFDNLDLSLVLKDGKYESFNYTTNKRLEINAPSQYLSSDTRLLSDHTRYMQMRKALGITSPLNAFTTEDMEKILKVYKIYDMLFMEAYLQNLHGYRPTEEFYKAFEKVETKNMKINRVSVDLENCTIIDEDDFGEKIKDLTMLSAGEQALFVMFTANKVLTN